MTREEAIFFMTLYKRRLEASVSNEMDKDIEAFDTAIKALKKKEKTGRWIGHREHCENLGVIPSGLGAYEWCSNCDCGIDVREWHRNNYNFCPNCGTRMFEPQERSDKE